MTTIATDGKSMAADGQTTRDDHIICVSTKKIRRLKSGKIVGCCGASGDEQLFIDWLEGEEKKPKLQGGFGAIVLDPKAGPRAYFFDCTSDKIEGNYAIGSGAQFALAAMDCGRSPAEAVKIASARCVFTGGKITTLHLEKQ